MSPLCIEILLWHYGSADQYPEWDKGSAQQEIKEWLQSHDLIRVDPKDGYIYYITERGRALVEKICNTPLPSLLWGYA